MSFVALAAAIGLRWLLDPLMGDTLPLVTLFGAVAAAIWLSGLTAAAIATVLAGLPDAVAIGLHFLPLPYVVMAVVGVWRSADKYREDPTWAGIAKAAVIVWGALMVFV